MKKPDHDITKLPAWAQSRIKVAEMRVEEAHERMGEVLSPSDGTVRGITFGYDREGSGRVFGIPPGETVHFYLSGDQDNVIDVRFRDEFVEISARKTMLIEPRASNVIYVRNRR